MTELANLRLAGGTYRCPKCRGKTPGPGQANACGVCLGNRTVSEEIARIYVEEGEDAYRQWMREFLGPA